MRLDSSRRALLMLLGCLLTALLFPGAFMAARVGVGGLLPGTAAVTGEEQRAGWADAVAALARQNLQIRQMLAARPPEGSPVAPFDAGSAMLQRDPVRAVPARVLHRDVSLKRHTLLIDMGSERGIETGFAVVHGNSLIGRVQAVAEGASRVIRIDDPSSSTVLAATVLAIDAGDVDGVDGAVPASVEQRGNGVARGVGKKYIVVGKLEAGEARIGDLVVTGAGSYGVPAGLLLGEVVEFDDADRDGEWEALVEPLRNLDTIVAVYVCVRRKLAPHVAPRETGKR